MRLFSILWPFGSFVESIFHYDKRNLYWSVLMMSVMLACSLKLIATADYNSDITRNMQHIVDYANYSIPEILLEKDVFLGLSARFFTLFTKELVVLCCIYYLIYTGLFLCCLNIVSKKMTYGQQPLHVLFALAAVFLVKPYGDFNSLRFAIATFFCIWCCLKILLENNKYFMIWILFTASIHFGFTILLPVPFLHYYLKDKLKIVWLLFVVSFALQGATTSYFMSNFANDHFNEELSLYVSIYASEDGLANMNQIYKDAAAHGNSNRAFSRMMVDVRNYGTMIIACLMSLSIYKKRDTFLYKFITFILLMYSMANIGGSASNGIRFLHVCAVMLVFLLFYMIIENLNDNKEYNNICVHNRYLVNIVFGIVIAYAMMGIFIGRDSYQYLNVFFGNPLFSFLF